MMLMSWGRPTVAGRVNAGFFFHRQCGSITHINWIVGRLSQVKSSQVAFNENVANAQTYKRM